MPDVLSTGLSGLLAFQRALDTTGHNIANANTEGYSRQRVELATLPASQFGNGWVGNGVTPTTVARQVDQFLVGQTRSSVSAAERLRVFASQAERVNNLLADSAAGLPQTLQGFSNALQGVATSPTSLAARQVLLGEAQATVDRLRSFDARLREFEASINSGVRGEVDEINVLAQGVARLNTEIAIAVGSNGQPPNDLLDQRDRLIDRLAGKVNVEVVPQDRGIVNLFVGNGQTLVLNQTANALDTQPDPFDPTRSIVVVRSDLGPVDVTRSIVGGSLGGLLDFRRQVLDPTRNELGRVALGVADAVNEQHSRGIDLTGALGAEFFSVGNVGVLDSSTNQGTATVSVTRADIGALTGRDYDLSFTATGWSLRRVDTSATVPLTGTGTAADPFRAEGLALVVSGTPAVGDRVLIRPTREAVGGFATRISEPSRIAAAAPILGQANESNVGVARITQGEVLDSANPQLRDPVEIQFLSASSYSINGAGSFAYTSGNPIEINGWRVAISGAAQAGDRFTVTDNSLGRGDNRNAQAMTEALGRPRFDNGTTSVPDAVTRIIGEVGVTTRQAQINRDAQEAMYRDAVTQRNNVSGVNLDEEAANLLRYQQAYQAAAQLIRIANDMFNTLLNATR